MKKIILLSVAIVFLSNALAAPLEGQLAFELGDYANARAQVVAAMKDNSSIDLALLLSRINVAQNRLDEAEVTLNQALKTQPNNASAHALLGQIFSLKASRASLFRIGKFAKKSLAAYELAQQNDPQHEAAALGMLHFRLNTPALFGGSIDKALSEAHKLLQINPIVGNLELANIYAKQNNQKQQIDHLKEILLLNPEDPRAPLALGFIEQRKRQWQQAIIYFSMAAQASKNDPKFINAIQSARYQLGRTNVLSKTTSQLEIKGGIEALTAYIGGRQFSDLPDLEWAYYRHGLLFDRLDNKNSEAMRDFAHAAETTDRDLLRALKSIR